MTDSDRKAGLQERLERLVSFNSISNANPSWDHSNERVIDQLAEWAKQAGFAVEKSANEGGSPSGAPKSNLICRYGSGAGGLLMSGHSDTVAYDAHQWHGDPLVLTEDGDRLRGLGTSDMKSFFAVFFQAFAELRHEAFVPHRPLYLVATADEESSMLGVRTLQGRLKELQPSLAVIGEPTELTPVPWHKGIMMLKLSLTGQSGHSSDPANGNSALEGMQEVMGGLLQWRELLQREHSDERFSVPGPTMNLGEIRGGDSPNRICAYTELSVDFRPIPGMDKNQAREQIRSLLADVAEKRGLAHQLEVLFTGCNPLNSSVAETDLGRIEKITGARRAVNYGTEAPYLEEVGLPTLVLGPGSIKQAHQSNEYITWDQLWRGVAIYRGLMEQYLIQ
jgi:acetylornithine deacetylase